MVETTLPYERFANPLFRARHLNGQVNLDSMQVAWSREYASQLAAGRAAATAIAVDRSDNIYVAGYSSNLPYGTDFVTIKYDRSGQQVWIKRFDSGGDDYPTGLVVDSSGNVVVVGTSQRADGIVEWTTVQYSSAGAERWVARQSGVSNLGGKVWAVSLDPQGNIILAGFMRTATQSVATAVKYSQGGERLWLADYVMPGSASTWFKAVVVDASGDIYFAGGTVGYSQSGDDVFVVKSAPDGTLRWLARYNSPQNGDDWMSGIGLDRFGNVFLGGTTSIVSGMGTDIFMLKYDTRGNLLWARQYDGIYSRGDVAYSMIVDSVGNAYVTGRCDGEAGSSSDLLTLKYSATGDVLWADRYDGLAQGFDWGEAISFDRSGNIIVAGVSRGPGQFEYGDDFITISYVPTGERRWLARYNGPGNAYDQAHALAASTGAIHVAGFSQGSGGSIDIATVQYSPEGQQQWVARYEPPGTSYEWPTACTVDASGNLYVTGLSVGTSYDYLTLKYDKGGMLQWAARYDGPARSYDFPTAIKVDQSGNVYVTGESSGLNTDRDYATVKYSAEGRQLWVARYTPLGEPSYLPDGAEAIEVDRHGNVYVTGAAFHTTSGMDAEITTIKYDSEGRQQWVVRGPKSYYSTSISLALDGAGHVFVSGTGRRTGTTNSIVVEKYNADGSVLWSSWHTDPSAYLNGALDLQVDALGNSYAAGWSRAQDFTLTVIIVKYNSQGQQQWVARYKAPHGESSFLNQFSIDREGNAYALVDNYSRVPGGSTNLVLVKFDTRGRQVWAIERPSEFSRSLAIDIGGNVYATGMIETSEGFTDNIVKYSPEGTVQWEFQTGNTTVQVTPVDFSGNLFLVGSRTGRTWGIVTVSKLSPAGGGQSRPEVAFLWSNYPNPFNSGTTIRYELPEAGHATLKLFNMLGEEIATLVDSFHLAGVHELTWGANDVGSGVYFCRLETKGSSVTRKLVLVR